MVDVGASELAQALSFRLLLTAVQRHPDWWRSFIWDLNGYNLLAKVLRCEQCSKGDLLLHVSFFVT